MKFSCINAVNRATIRVHKVPESAACPHTLRISPLTTTSHYLICVVDFAGGTELTISADSVEQIKKHMALSLQRMQELEDQVRLIPVMQVRIKGHKV